MMSNILIEHPDNQVANLRLQSYSGSNKFPNTRPIKNSQLRVHTVYNRGHYKEVSWDALLDLSNDDYLRLDAESNKPNPRAGWVLGVEQDGADYFYQEISAVVLSKFTEYPRIFNQSQMGPPPGRSGKFVDSVYYWKDTSDNEGRLHHVALIGEFKRNVLKPYMWQAGNIESDNLQVALSRELRGLAVEYSCPQIFCFDLDAFRFLQFRATRESKMSDSDCPVDCWIFRRTETEFQYPSEPIRYVLYRFIIQGIRRSQSHGYPVATINGVTPKGRLFFNREPIWQRLNGKVGPGHPLGYRRAVDESNGALAWQSDNKEWLFNVNGGKVYDSKELWWIESTSSSSEGDVEIYDAD
ncbi:hypothetical protein CLIM01_11979 [Colletotrichum limetticola]|uniref:Uncharacterized protein n=1 Tax=Colletotrichum limetticola TaxID=1209924 RepID=A0ABQ9PJN1_9PEZI|nr:hypothetical protein CLIM01_11979 [Colletotrichum limetticola]